MKKLKKAVLLVGHGGLPKDISPEIVEQFMRVHKARLKAGGPVSQQEIDLDKTIRNWERTEKNDPYKAGLEALSAQMEPLLEGYIVKTAYNEFCHPSIEDAVGELAQQDVSEIIIATTMITRGGSHSEKEIPEEIRQLSQKHRDIRFQYAWPFNMNSFAEFLSDHVKSFDPAVALH